MREIQQMGQSREKLEHHSALVCGAGVWTLTGPQALKCSYIAIMLSPQPTFTLSTSPSLLFLFPALSRSLLASLLSSGLWWDWRLKLGPWSFRLESSLHNQYAVTLPSTSFYDSPFLFCCLVLGNGTSRLWLWCCWTAYPVQFMHCLLGRRDTKHHSLLFLVLSCVGRDQVTALKLGLCQPNQLLPFMEVFIFVYSEPLNCVYPQFNE